MADYTVSAVQVQQTLDWVNKFFPNDESLSDYAARLKDQYLNTGLTNAQILANLKANLRLALQASIKGIPSNKDQGIIDKILEGGATIQGIQQFRNALENSVRRITLEANTIGEAYKRFQRGEAMTTEYIQEMASRVPIAGIETPEDEEKQNKESVKEVQQKEVGTTFPDRGTILFKRPNGVISEASIDAPWLSTFLNMPENVAAVQGMQTGRISQRNKLAFQQRLNEHVAKTLAEMQTQQSTNTQ
jgi:hypothetical protein